MKNELICLVLLAILSYIQADTKVLHRINIQDDNFNRQETFSLKNPNTPQEELVIEGVRTENFDSKNSNFVYRLETIYVADKDGYRAKYKLVGEAQKPEELQEAPEPEIHIFLSGSTLKTLAG